MSRDSAKAHYAKQPGDPDEGFITASDAQAAIDDIYDDMSAPAVIADGSVTSGKIAADAVGSAQIATGAVGSGELATDAVTSDKIADGAVSNAHVASDAAIAASKVAGTAVTQADTGTVTNGMLAGSIAKTKVAGTAITAADTGTVTGTMIGTGEVGNGNLAANAVNEAKIASGAVTTVKIEDDAVTTAKIAADAVTSAQIAANAVGASELADNAVDTAAIAADAVTADKIANDIRQMHNDLGDAIESVQTELGTNPSGSDATVAARLSAIEAVASPLYGTSGVNAAKWRTALRRVRRGGKARIVCVGTSNTFGWGPTDPATMNYPALLAGNLENLLGVRVGWGLEPFNRFTVPGVDPGVVHERPWFTKGNWNIAASAYWADTGGAEGEPGQGAGPTLTLDVKDGFSFLYVDRTAGRTFKYRVDGGTATTVTTTGTNEVREQIVTVGTAGTHTLEFLDPTVGTAIILAAGEHVANGITVCNWGAPGLATASLVKDAGQWWAGMNALDAASPDLVIIEAGSNDSNVSQFQTDLDTLVSFIQSNTSASVIVCESYGSNSETFAPAARSVAETRGVDSLSWLDILQGDRDPWRASVLDPDHFSQDGFEVIAAGVTQAVLGAHPRLRF